ncbi:zinc-dependent metalloprotease [Neolewinella antarctica]|uniref:Peptidase M12B domain-containing protein n=1 Tax=Neolewinella antarctica TaxID=442734 RepID=A0ABX0XB73_9BACT|nr:M12 family metallo-peptidase [Neolewinella antarctica]NJC26500.1 hypothetical protein [Neolewinella antarctica]
MRSFNYLLVLLCTALLTPGLNAQSLRPADQVEAVTAAAGFEASFSLFVTEKSTAPVDELDKVGADYTVFSLAETDLDAIQKSTPRALQLALPGGLGRVNLVLNDIFAAGFRVVESGNGGYTKEGLGLHYRGVLENNKNSVVALSIFENEVSATISTSAGNYVLGKLQGKGQTNHILYNDQDLPAVDMGECATPDSNLPYNQKDLLDIDVSEKDANNCVNVYIEVDNSIFAQRGNGTTAFITGLFNQVATLYANESLNIVMSEMFVWTTADPYNGSTSRNHLDDFQANRPSFNGDIAHLIGFQASGGIAYVNVLCSPSVAYGFSSIDNRFENVPTYSWSVNVVAHELGHNFGSQHTHACAWNGNGTPIDGCYPTEGNCGSAPIPSGGGTIMSYCHLTSVGVNFNLGFGTQPGNLMRNRAFNGSCLTACSTPPGDGGGGGGTPPACEDTEGSIKIVTDSYPAETTWSLTSANGATVASGGPYTGINSTYVTDLCLPVGCYTFTINDEYGDGICCAYGNGSYTVNIGGTDVATGSQFATTFSDEICVQGDGGGGDDGGGETVCSTVDFNTYPPNTYGGNQDRGTVSVQSAESIQLSGNAWKDINLNYTVTPNTVITFDFGSTTRGEIHGIGFDNDNGISSPTTFKLFGTQNWGIRDFDTYTAGDLGTWKSFTIPVGDYFTGAFNRMVFANDHDSSPQNATSFFRNIRIYEGTSCVALLPANGEPIELFETASLIEQQQINVFPNPASRELNVTVEVASAGDARVRVIDMTGRTVITQTTPLAKGQQSLGLDVESLPQGTYFLRVDANGGFSASAKFNVAR